MDSGGLGHGEHNIQPSSKHKTFLQEGFGVTLKGSTCEKLIALPSSKERLLCLGDVPLKARGEVLLYSCLEAPVVIKSISAFEKIGLNYSNRWDDGVTIQAISGGAPLLKLLTCCPNPSALSPCKIDIKRAACQVPKLNGEWPFSFDDLDDTVEINPRPYGRTLIYVLKNGERMAVKLRKSEEPLSEFEREAATQMTLMSMRDELQLKSNFPICVGIGTLDVPLGHVGKILDSTGKKVNLHGGLDDKPTSGECLVYKMMGTDAYFDYINQGGDTLSVDDLTDGLSNAAFDIFACASKGWMYTQLVDLFHSAGKTRAERALDGGGRALMLVDLVRADDASVGGMGSIKDIHQGTAYPNIRRTGLADLGDALPMGEVVRPLKIVRCLCHEMKLLTVTHAKETSFDWTELYLDEFADKLRASAKEIRGCPPLMELLAVGPDGDGAIVLNDEDLAKAVLAFSINSPAWPACAHMVDLCRLQSGDDLVNRARVELLAEQMVCIMLLGLTYFLRRPDTCQALAAEAAECIKSGSVGSTIQQLKDVLLSAFCAAAQGFLGGKVPVESLRQAVQEIASFDLLALQLAAFGTMTKEQMATQRNDSDALMAAVYPETEVNWDDDDNMANLPQYQMAYEEGDSSLAGLPKHLGSPGTQMPIKAFEQLAYALSTLLLAGEIAGEPDELAK